MSTTISKKTKVIFFSVILIFVISQILINSYQSNQYTNLNECIFKESAKLKDINSESSRITEEYCADLIAKKEEDRRIAEENKRIEEQKKQEEAARRDKEKKALEAKKEEDQRIAEENKRLEEQKKQEEAARRDKEKKAREAKKEEDQRIAEKNKKIEELKKIKSPVELEKNINIQPKKDQYKKIESPGQSAINDGNISTESLPLKKDQGLDLYKYSSQTWIYSYKDLSNNISGTINFSIKQDGNKIIENGIFDFGSEKFNQTRSIAETSSIVSFQNQNSFVVFNEVMPYLNMNNDIDKNTKIPKIIASVSNHSSLYDDAWLFRYKIIGVETITIKNKQYDAVKINISGIRPTMPGHCTGNMDGEINVSIWYAKNIKRYIKQEFKTFGCFFGGRGPIRRDEVYVLTEFYE